MKSSVFIQASAIFTTITALITLTACNGGQAIEPASSPPASPPTETYAPPPETSTPEPVKPPAEDDTPALSETEMAAFLWNRLPEQLNSEYQKSQFATSSKTATYQGGGRWLFQAAGSESKTVPLPLKKYEKSPGYWVEASTRQVTSCNLSLQANYYEKTGTLEITGIEKSDETTQTETLSEKRIVGEGVKVKWINATTSGQDLRIDCSVRNIGIVALEDLVMQVNIYNTQNNLIKTENITMSPSKIEVGQDGSFYVISQLSDPLVATREFPFSTQTFGTYTYRFILPSEKEIAVQRIDGSIYYPTAPPTT